MIHSSLHCLLALQRATLVLTAIITLIVSCGAEVLHVRGDGPLGGDGRSWDTAFRSPSSALRAASHGDEIWVAAGSYTPIHMEGPIGEVSGVSIAAVSSNLSLDHAPVHLVDGNGLAGEEHGNLPNGTMWLSESDDQMPWVQFDLGRSCNLRQLQIWNFNAGIDVDLTELGARQIRVEVSAGVDLPMAELGVLDLPRATGASNYGVPRIRVVADDVRLVRLTILSNHGKGSQAGLSEVRFHALELPAGTSKRSASFVLRDGVGLYGGFLGTETERTMRNPDPFTNGTVLSGDIGANDGPTFGARGDNAFHVVLSENNSVQTTIDGFTVSGGFANVYVKGRRDHYGAGVLSVESRASFRNLRITDNATWVNIPDSGGAIGGGGMYHQSTAYASRGNIIQSVAFEGNHSQYGGGLCAVGNFGPWLEDVEFRDNTADKGGAIYARHALTMAGCTFLRNVASLDGGAVFNRKDRLTVRDTTFVDNRGKRGGAIAAPGGSPPGTVGEVVVENSEFIRNHGSQQGGAIMSHNSITATGCTFRENSSGPLSYGRGGALISTNIRAEDCVFRENSAKGSGGAIYCGGHAETEYRVVRCEFSGNTSELDGGGLYVYVIHRSIQRTVENCVFSGNHCSHRGGGICIVEQYDSDLTPLVSSLTVSGNAAGERGGGIYNSSLSPRLTNSIVWGNSAPSAPELGGAPLESLSGANILGGTIFGEDPQFLREPNSGDGDWTTRADNDYGNLRLAPGSPAIDSGANAVAAGTVDLDGSPRIAFGESSSTIDLGAYEFVAERSSEGEGLRIRWGKPGIRLDWKSEPGVNYIIEFSPDLQNWVALPVGNVDTWTDTRPLLNRFYYRLRTD